jgi:hypothetical protein
MRWVTLLIITVAICLLCACGDENCTSPSPQPDPLAEFKSLIAQTPRANQEAEEMALWLSGDLVAPESLYEQVLDGVTRLREAYADSIPELDSIGFRPEWISGYIGLSFDSVTAMEVIDGSYHDWDSLNTLLKVTRIQGPDTTGIIRTWHAGLYFEGRLHYERLSEMYSGLRGVKYTGWAGWGGDYPNLYPWINDGMLTFLLRDADGDCMAGCYWSKFWYFRVESDRIDLVGSYDTDGHGPVPDWWQEARESFCEFMQDHHWVCQ